MPLFFDTKSTSFLKSYSLEKYYSYLSKNLSMSNVHLVFILLSYCLIPWKQALPDLRILISRSWILPRTSCSDKISIIYIWICYIFFLNFFLSISTGHGLLWWWCFCCNCFLLADVCLLLGDECFMLSIISWIFCFCFSLKVYILLSILWSSMAVHS